MAFLLLLHQKMKLQRKENALTLKQLRFSSKVDRMQKKVDKRQKYYDKLKKQLERQANYYKNNANIFFSQMAGLGTNSINLANPYGSNAATLQVLRNMSPEQMNAQLGLTDKSKFQIDPDLAKAIQSGCYAIADSDKEINGNKITKGQVYNPYDPSQIYGTTNDPQAAATAIQSLQQFAQMQVSQKIGRAHV